MEPGIFCVLKKYGNCDSISQNRACFITLLSHFTGTLCHVVKEKKEKEKILKGKIEKSSMQKGDTYYV